MRASILWPLALASTACGGSSPSYVGGLGQTDAKMALVQDGDARLVYVCGGPATLTTHTRWFRVPGGSAEVTVDGWTLRLDPDHDASGTVAPPSGGDLAFTLLEVQSGSAAGLYGDARSPCRTGAIVVADGAGAAGTIQGAGCDSAGTVQQVTPDGPLPTERQSFAVRIGGGETTTLDPVGP